MTVSANTKYSDLVANDTVTSVTLVAQWKDIQKPVITGLETGKTYCDTVEFEVSDNDGIASVKANGSALTATNGKYTLAKGIGTVIVVATDNAGNTAQVSVTVNDGHTDENKDHKCDLCNANVGEHKDEDKNHACDYGCSVAIGAHEDTDKDHACDYCGAEMTVCKDDDKDHLCDVCGETLSQHSGGKATCVSKAVCDECGSEYGEIDSSNHHLENIPAKDATRRIGVVRIAANTSPMKTAQRKSSLRTQ